MDEETKKPKKDVDYRLGEGSKICKNCTMYRYPNECTAVRGYIDEIGLCNLFKRKK